MHGDCSAKFVSDIIIILSVHKLYDYDIADIGGRGDNGPPAAKRPRNATQLPHREHNDK